MNRTYLRFGVIWALILATIYIGDRFVRDVFLTADDTRAITPRGDLADSENTTVTLFAQAAPSVVYIFTQGGNARYRAVGNGYGAIDARHKFSHVHT